MRSFLQRRKVLTNPSFVAKETVLAILTRKNPLSRLLKHNVDPTIQADPEIKEKIRRLATECSLEELGKFLSELTNPKNLIRFRPEKNLYQDCFLDIINKKLAETPPDIRQNYDSDLKVYREFANKLDELMTVDIFIKGIIFDVEQFASKEKGNSELTEKIERKITNCPFDLRGQEVDSNQLLVLKKLGVNVEVLNEIIRSFKPSDIVSLVKNNNQKYSLSDQIRLVDAVIEKYARDPSLSKEISELNEHRASYLIRQESIPILEPFINKYLESDGRGHETVKPLESKLKENAFSCILEAIKDYDSVCIRAFRRAGYFDYSEREISGNTLKKIEFSMLVDAINQTLYYIHDFDQLRVKNIDDSIKDSYTNLMAVLHDWSSYSWPNEETKSKIKTTFATISDKLNPRNGQARIFLSPFSHSSRPSENQAPSHSPSHSPSTSPQLANPDSLALRILKELEEFIIGNAIDLGNLRKIENFLNGYGIRPLVANDYSAEQNQQRQEFLKGQKQAGGFLKEKNLAMRDIFLSLLKNYPSKINVPLLKIFFDNGLVINQDHIEVIERPNSSAQPLPELVVKMLQYNTNPEILFKDLKDRIQLLDLEYDLWRLEDLIDQNSATIQSKFSAKHFDELILLAIQNNLHPDQIRKLFLNKNIEPQSSSLLLTYEDKYIANFTDFKESMKARRLFSDLKILLQENQNKKPEKDAAQSEEKAAAITTLDQLYQESNFTYDQDHGQKYQLAVEAIKKILANPIKKSKKDKKGQKEPLFSPIADYEIELLSRSIQDSHVVAFRAMYDWMLDLTQNNKISQEDIKELLEILEHKFDIAASVYHQIPAQLKRGKDDLSIMSKEAAKKLNADKIVSYIPVLHQLLLAKIEDEDYRLQHQEIVQDKFNPINFRQLDQSNIRLLQEFTKSLQRHDDTKVKELLTQDTSSDLYPSPPSSGASITSKRDIIIRQFQDDFGPCIIDTLLKMGCRISTVKTVIGCGIKPQGKALETLEQYQDTYKARGPIELLAFYGLLSNHFECDIDQKRLLESHIKLAQESHRSITDEEGLAKFSNITSMLGGGIDENNFAMLKKCLERYVDLIDKKNLDRLLDISIAEFYKNAGQESNFGWQLFDSIFDIVVDKGKSPQDLLDLSLIKTKKIIDAVDDLDEKYSIVCYFSNFAGHIIGKCLKKFAQNSELSELDKAQMKEHLTQLLINTTTDVQEYIDAKPKSSSTAMRFKIKPSSKASQLVLDIKQPQQSIS